MQLAFEILFWLCFYLILHTYLIYPALLSLLAKNKSLDIDKFSPSDNLPNVSIIMAAHNEEKIIEQKINSVFNTSYPIEKLDFYIGTDNCTDSTNEIIKKYQQKYPNLHLFEFKERNGKIKIINFLKKQTSSSIIISTDAKVIFKKDTIFRMIEFFKTKDIKMVGGNLVNSQFDEKGISNQENHFMNREIMLKYREGVLWGHSIGIYGALFAIRKDEFVDVPQNLLVDDFYINLKVLENGGKAVFNLDALAIEDLPQQLNEEFRRKVRISTGNFQNLKIFAKHLLKPFNSISFAYISHKVLRWIAPHLFFVMLISLLFLCNVLIYRILAVVFGIIFFIPLLDFLLQKININIKLFRYLTHFIAMNFAMVVGFFKSLKGVKNSYWKPSKRVN